MENLQARRQWDHTKYRKEINPCQPKIPYLASLYFTNERAGLVQQLTPVFIALREAKVGGSRGQEFETSLTNMVNPHL